jgi:integrase
MAYKDRRSKSKLNGRHSWVAAITVFDATLGYKDRKAEQPFPTKQAALQREQEIKQEAAAGVYVTQNKKRTIAKVKKRKKVSLVVGTIAEFKDEYIEHQSSKLLRDGKKLSHAYISEKESLISCHLIPGFPMPMNEIDEEAVDKFNDSLVAFNYSSSTITNILGELRVVLKLAKRWKRIKSVPDFSVPGKQLGTVDKIISMQDLAILLKNALPEVRLPILFAVSTGVRFGSLVAAKWGDFDFTDATFLVQRSFVEGKMKHPKSRKNRIISLDDQILSVLLFHRKNSKYHKDEDFIFPRPDGSNYCYRELYPLLIKSCDRAGINRISWHWFRHTYITMLTMAGVTPRIVQELAGHSDIRLTMARYTKINHDAKRAAANSLLKIMPAEFSARELRANPI